MISISEDLKRLRLSGVEFRKSLFAETLVRVLENFSYISGLKLNAKKCQVLRIGIMVKSTVIYLKIRKFQWSSTKANALGMTFTTKKENIFQVNLKPKIRDFRKCL